MSAGIFFLMSSATVINDEILMVRECEKKTDRRSLVAALNVTAVAPVDACPAPSSSPHHLRDLRKP